MRKENKNFLYNVIYQIFSLLMPLITAPYISRVLGVDNIGVYAFTHSIVEYFMLVALLGINNYGSREIAKISQTNDKEKISKVFCEIYYLQLGIGTIMLILYVSGILLFVDINKTLALVQGIYIVSAILDINWFYFGLEKFKITVVRNTIVKLIALILIFVFVRNDTDLLKYAIIMSGSALVSQLYLWVLLKKYVRFMQRKFADIFRHFKECFILFIPVIAYSIYRIMDKTMLGAISGTVPLGYYQNAENIINIPVVLVTALGTVMIPSMSKNVTKKEYDSKLFNSFELVFLFVLPVITSLFVMGPDLATVLYGSGFEESGNIARILGITILFAGIANVIRTNFLIPKRENKTYVVSTIVGACVNLLLNSILIPICGVYGACVGTIVAEFSVMGYQIFVTRFTIDYKKMLRKLFIYVLKAVPICVAQAIIILFVNDSLSRLVIGVLVTVPLFWLFNYKYILYDFFGKNKERE